MKPLFAYSLVVASLALPASAHAHFIWAIVDPAGKQIRMEVAETPGDSVVPMLGKMLPGIGKFGIGALVDEADHFHISGAVTGRDSTGGADLVYGVHGDFLVHWCAKGAANLSAAGKSIGLPTEIVLHRSKAGLVARVTKGGKAAPGAEFYVQMPGHKAATEMKTGADGTVKFGASPAGLLALSAIVHVPGAGNYKGTHYVETRDMVTLTVRIGK